jgi:hypothetical protein
MMVQYTLHARPGGDAPAEGIRRAESRELLLQPRNPLHTFPPCGAGRVGPHAIAIAIATTLVHVVLGTARVAAATAATPVIIIIIIVNVVVVVVVIIFVVVVVVVRIAATTTGPPT